MGLNSTLVHRVKSRISRRLTSPRKFRRAVLCTSRMSRSSAGPCALRLSCVSLRGSVQHGIRELICVHSAAPVRSCYPPSLSSRVFLKLMGRSSFLYHCCVFCGFPQPSHRHPLRGSRRWHTLCLFHLPHVSFFLLLCVFWFYVSVIGGYRSVALRRISPGGGVQNFFASRSSSELNSHQFPLGAPRGQEVQNFTASCSSSEPSSHQISLRAPFGCLRQVSIPVSWVEHHYSLRAVLLCTSSSSLTTPSEASRHYTCTRRESATTAYFGCMELPLPPRLALLRGHEGDGTCPPRPPGSSPRPCSLHPGQAGLRFKVFLGGRSLLVDASGRQSSTLFPPLCCLSLWRFSGSVFLVSVATLRAVLQLLGPADGRQLALKVPRPCVFSTVAQRLSRIPSCRQW